MSNQAVGRRLAVPVLAPGSGVVPSSPPGVASPHFTDRNGLILASINLYLIFWGRAWASGGVPPVIDIARAAQLTFDSPYFSGLSQYRGSKTGRLKSVVQVTDSDPPNPFTNDQIANLVHQRINKGELPEPDDDPSALYCVILPAGVPSSNAGVIGEHSYFVYLDVTDLHFPPDIDIARAHYGWVSNDGTLDFVTTVLSHELAESFTDPNGDGIQGVSGVCAQSGWCEIGDVCSDTAVVNGVRVQAYWSERDQACIIPGRLDGTANSVDTSGGLSMNTAAAATKPTSSSRAADAPPVSSQEPPAWRRFASGASYTGGLLASAWLGPLVATLVLVAGYVAPSLLPPWAKLVSDSPALAGPVVAVVFWLVIGLLYSPAASARNANASSYADLQARLAQLNARLASLAPGDARSEPAAESATHAKAMASELDSAGPRWVTAVGYVSLWKRLHRAEEAIIEVEPRTQVLADAAYDTWRMQNSTIQHSTDLVADLQQASTYLRSVSPDGSVSAAPAAAAAPPAPPAPSVTPLAPVVSIGSEAEARAIVRRVRFAVNDFRDSRWAALISARNLLYGTMIATELAAFALLALAVIGHSPGSAIVAGIVFFLVGALVGLYNRLSQQATAGTTVEDYSLAWVRLILTPMLSGLAAIGGVVLTGMLTLSGLTGLVQPGGSGSTANTVTLPVLQDIFDLNHFRIGFLLAVVFGGTPLLFGSRLQQLTDQYKNDLKSTEATGSSSTTTAPGAQ